MAAGLGTLRNSACQATVAALILVEPPPWTTLGGRDSLPLLVLRERPSISLLAIEGRLGCVSRVGNALMTGDSFWICLNVHWSIQILLVPCPSSARSLRQSITCSELVGII